MLVEIIVAALAILIAQQASSALKRSAVEKTELQFGLWRTLLFEVAAFLYTLGLLLIILGSFTTIALWLGIDPANLKSRGVNLLWLAVGAIALLWIVDVLKRRVRLKYPVFLLDDLETATKIRKITIPGTLCLLIISEIIPASTPFAVAALFLLHFFSALLLTAKIPPSYGIFIVPTIITISTPLSIVPFMELAGAGSVVTGTGLGLAIVLSAFVFVASTLGSLCADLARPFSTA
ncbi:MAG: hypothetical protein AAF830_10625 [Pseudomonadota bacterium]